jgi:hypothetical protein
MKIKLLTLSMVFSAIFLANAQNQKQVFACNYYGKKINERALCNQFYGFADKSAAEAVVKKIVDLSGLPANFYLIECPNVDNCFATVVQEEAVIIYDNNFMRKANDMTHNNWAEISILAHEIGHHLSMHTIKSGGSDPKKELEADEFSGFIMYKMGASLTDAQAAIKKLTSDYDGGSHPPRTQRLAAIEKGYKKSAILNASNTGGKIDIPVYTENKSQPKTEQAPPVVQAPKPQQKPREMPPEVVIVDNSVDKPTKMPNSVDNSTNSSTENTNIETKTVKKGGCMEGDCSEGYGVAMNSKTEEIYKGEWREGKREGKGIEFYANGKKKYEGDYSLGKWQGNGTFFSPEGNIFVGKFKENLLNCEQCLVYYKNGDRYLGKFVNGKKNGKGVIIRKDGRREEVVFVNDVNSKDYANRFK